MFTHTSDSHQIPSQKKTKSKLQIKKKLQKLQNGHQMRDGSTDGRMDRRADSVKPIYIPQQLRCWWGGGGADGDGGWGVGGWGVIIKKNWKVVQKLSGEQDSVYENINSPLVYRGDLIMIRSIFYTCHSCSAVMKIKHVTWLDHSN